MIVGVTPRVRAGALLAQDWDAVVVGSGLGGLTCATLLALRAKMRVLVLERHYEIGGLSQTFRRRRYAWEVGVHYVGDVGGGMPRKVLDLATGERVRWARLPALHDRLVAPGIDLRLGGDRAALRMQWLSVARGEERAVDRILDAVDDCARGAAAHALNRLRPGARPSERSGFLAWSDRTVNDVIAESGASPLLALLVTYAWTDFGMPPDEASFAALAITMSHYYRGAFYPVGGGGTLARAMAQSLAAAGGAVVTRAEVAHAIIRDGRAEGVVLKDGTEIRCERVISDVGARGTFDWLAPGDTEARARMHAIGRSGAHVGLYVGLDRPPAACGIDGTNRFLVRDAPGETRRDWARWFAGDDAEPSELFVSTVCASDPSFATRHPDRSVLSIAAPILHACFAPWTSSVYAHRDASYEAAKARLGESMMRVVRRHMPELGAADHVEISTPLTTQHFTHHGAGEIYGLAPTPMRFRHGPGPHTSTRGLFLTGQDVWSGGVLGATFGGLLTACAITKRDFLGELALR
jgi:all-trans-retinol 13,14-reductase